MRLTATNNQARAVRIWASAYLPGYATSELAQALAIVRAHPDSYSPGYSQAKQARQRLQVELAMRPAAEAFRAWQAQQKQPKQAA